MRKILPLIWIVGLLAVMEACKTARIATTDTATQERDSIPEVVRDSVPEKVLYITSKGDTLEELGTEVSLELHRVLRDTISIAAVGDIMMGTNFPNPSYLPPDSGFQLWKYVQTTLQSQDITFGNLEGVILNSGGQQKECRNPNACYLFRTPDHLSFHFRESGFDLMGLANNHANDFGPEGRANTQRILDSLGIHHAGSAEAPFSIRRMKGLKVGFVAFAPNKGTLSLHDETRAVEIVQLLDSLTDVVIVSFHAGAEGPKHQHVTRKREFYYGEDRGNVYQFARLVIDHGADILLGHGPHVVRGIEVYRKRLIAYSLGNFLTYGRFNLGGPNGYAPLLTFNITSQGEFISGFIHSFIQDYALGPIPDPQLRAARTIKLLSETDFPENEISIEDSGRILYLQP